MAKGYPLYPLTEPLVSATHRRLLGAAVCFKVCSPRCQRVLKHGAQTGQDGLQTKGRQNTTIGKTRQTQRGCQETTVGKIRLVKIQRE